jgi:tripartite-type tricarboxylate transporter receptor subunit TctC
MEERPSKAVLHAHSTVNDACGFWEISMRGRLVVLAICVFLLTMAPSAWPAVAKPSGSASYPSRPIRLITPGGAASNLDYRARQISQKLTPALGQQIIVDNRPGANSIIGTEIAAHAPADGYTMLFGYHALVMNPHLYAKLPYDVSKQLVPVIGFNTGWVGIYIPAAIPANTLQDFIALAKAKKGQLTCVSTGNGSGQHLSCHRFNMLTGSGVRVIHFKELGQALGAMLGGQIREGFDGLPLLLGPIKAGKLKMLAISGPARVVSLPSVPTFSEAGLPQFEMVFWTGVLAPTGTPTAVIELINREINAALRAPDIRQSLLDTGATPLGGTAADFGNFMRTESDKWRSIIKDSGARLD